MNIEWAKLKAVAQHLNCTELVAKERIDNNEVQVFTEIEFERFKKFMKRLGLERIDEIKTVQLNFNGNNFKLWEKGK